MASTPTPTTGDDLDIRIGEDHSADSAADRDPDPTARRQAAQEAANAAEARAAAAATEAKAAIAAAARAAAMADAAAQDAEQADAAVRVAAQAEARAAADAARTAAHRASRPTPEPRPTPSMERSVRSAPSPQRSTEDFDDGPVARRRPHRDGDASEEQTRATATGHAASTGHAATADGGGRAARHRSAAAATSVFAAVSDAPAPSAEEPTALLLQPRRRLRRPAPPVLAAAAAGGVLALGVVLLAGNVVRTSPQPAAVVETAPTRQPVVPVLPSPDADAGEVEVEGEVDTLSDRAIVYLQELRAAGVPTSRGGLAETEAADLVCNEIEDGVDEARIARALPASLPTVDGRQAAELVEIAKENYCV